MDNEFRNVLDEVNFISKCKLVWRIDKLIGRIWTNRSNPDKATDAGLILVVLRYFTFVIHFRMNYIHKQIFDISYFKRSWLINLILWNLWHRCFTWILTIFRAFWNTLSDTPSDSYSTVKLTVILQFYWVTWYLNLDTAFDCHQVPTNWYFSFK